MTDLVEDIQTEIDALVSQGEQVKEKVEDYRDRASAIDEAYRRRNEDRNNISLDDLPFGEELVRTSGLPEQLERAIKKLEAVDLNTQPVAVVAKQINDAREIIDNADAEVDDCTSLPPEDEDEDDFP